MHPDMDQARQELAASGTLRVAASGLQGISACIGMPSARTSRQLKVGLQAVASTIAPRAQADRMGNMG